MKAQLPASKASGYSLADVAAMATEGGVIIYVVLEDKAAMSFSPTPLELAGVKDRISDVVTANVRERVDFDIRLLPLDKEPARGFVVVDIPASARRPTWSKPPESSALWTGTWRQRGTDEALITFLRPRHREVELQAEQALDQAIAAAPLSALPGTRGDLHLVARPLLSDRGLRRRAWPGDEGQELGGGIGPRGTSGRNVMRRLCCPPSNPRAQPGPGSSAV